ncbi:MAG: hypothetical protein V1874_04145 [Spirochaetota bacterium]
MDQDEKDKQDFENLRTEYSSLIDYHNSIVSHRFTLLGFYLAALGLIVQKEMPPENALLIIAITVAMYIIERRNRALYTQMGKRAIEIEKEHWKLIRYNEKDEIKELPLFCRFWKRELQEKLPKKLTEELREEIKDKPKFLNKFKLSFLPASHSLGLDWLYLSVMLYAIWSLLTYREFSCKGVIMDINKIVLNLVYFVFAFSITMVGYHLIKQVIINKVNATWLRILIAIAGFLLIIGAALLIIFKCA